MHLNIQGLVSLHVALRINPEAHCQGDLMPVDNHVFHNLPASQRCTTWHRRGSQDITTAYSKDNSKSYFPGHSKGLPQSILSKLILIHELSSVKQRSHFCSPERPVLALVGKIHKSCKQMYSRKKKS